MVGILYKDYPNDFIQYVDGLKRHNVKLSDMRWKQICNKWQIEFSVDNKGGYWINAEWDDKLHKAICDLNTLKIK